ncbi:MAG: CoA pyrophosphatase [Acidobacteria bacterium]|nr:MAG: CoA pyrophosphatase [Acidobacteriota bacterium]
MWFAIEVSLSGYARTMEIWSLLENLPPVVDPPGCEASVLIPLYADSEGDVRVVLTKRPDDMATHPGDIVFPGGHREDGEDPTATAKREAWEEIRLPPENIVSILGGLTPVTMQNREKPIVPIVARIERPKEFIPDAREVALILEPTLVELLDESSWVTRDWFGHDLWFRAFPEGVLWGATAAMMRELLSYLRT